MLPLIGWNLISLEILMTITLVCLVIVDILLPKDILEDWISTLSFIALFGLIIFWSTQRNLSGVTFSGMFVMDSLAWFFKGLFSADDGFCFCHDPAIL